MRDDRATSSGILLMARGAAACPTALAAGLAAAKPHERPMPLQEYDPQGRFTGVIGRTADVSTPAWPRPVRAREGTPNGGHISTPNIDALAADGLLFSSAARPSNSMRPSGKARFNVLRVE